MSDILAKIAADKRVELEALKEQLPLSRIERELSIPNGRLFKAALDTKARVKIIAELKKASPSKGVLAENFNPAALAAQYQSGGASALSVLTETKYFLGDSSYLRVAKEASGLPVLCKDFMVDEYQFFHARYMQADAVLLIARMHDAATLRRFLELSDSLGLDVLVETHNEQEVRMSLDCGANMIGVNNRDLATFTVDFGIAERIAKLIPDNITKVVESGIQTKADVARMQAVGYDCFLIGESLMKSADPAALLRELRTA